MGWGTEIGSDPHTGLTVWRLGMRLAHRIYEATEDFPTREKFELASQLRRAAVSIPSNIAEGSARRTNADFLNFLYTARGSLVELDTQMRLASELGYLDSETADDTHDIYQNLRRALQGLITKLEHDD